VELLTVLIVTGFEVEVAIGDLDCPLGILEHHLLLVVPHMGNVLLAFSLAGRQVAAARLLLLLLMELLHELIDLLALLRDVAPGIVHRAPQPTLVVTGGLVRSLVAMWVMAPISRYCQHLPVAC
jgi:hypothetical protein